MRGRHHVAGWRPVTAIGVAGLTAGMMLAGGIGEASAPAPLASAGITNSGPPALQREIVLQKLNGQGLVSACCHGFGRLGAVMRERPAKPSPY